MSGNKFAILWICTNVENLNSHKSHECLSLGAEATWSQRSSVVHYTHWLVTSVAWNSYILVFYDILFDDCHSCCFSCGLWVGPNICICGWDEAVVPWDVLGHLSSSYGQFVLLVALRHWIMWQDRSWFVTMLAESISEFTEVVASWWAVGLSINWPEGSSWNDSVLVGDLIYNTLVCWLPVSSWDYILSDGLSSGAQGHWSISTLFHFTCNSMSSGELFISSELGAIVELWVVYKFITD